MTEKVVEKFFSVDKINQCLSRTEMDLKGVGDGNIAAMRRIRACLLEMAKECKEQRKCLMVLCKNQCEKNKISREQKLNTESEKSLKPLKLTRQSRERPNEDKKQNILKK